MKRILFVDDEERVLAGLKRMLRPQRETWELHFASSGPEALALMAERDFDVVVSDVKMPGMDGISLLSEIQGKYPDLVRIILSGHTDAGDTMRATGVAHQYLAKPCDPDMLKETVARSSAIRGELANESLRQVIAATKSLPSMPALYSQVTNELSGPDPSLARVGDVISQDAGMSAKILQLVNSSFFGMRRQITDVRQAVTMLGLDIVIALVMSVHLFQQARVPSTLKGRLDRMWTTSLLVANTARAIAKAEGASKEAAEDAFLAGVLHDCGSLVLVSNWPDECEDLESAADAEEERALERSLFGAEHGEVGAYLLSLWGLPDTIVEAVGLHHEPSRSETSTFSPLTAVHVARALEMNEPLDVEYIKRIGLDSRIDAWKDVVADEVYRRENP